MGRVDSVQCKVCSVQVPVCSVNCASYGGQCAVCVQCAVSSLAEYAVVLYSAQMVGRQVLAGDRAWHTPPKLPPALGAHCILLARITLYLLKCS